MNYSFKIINKNDEKILNECCEKFNVSKSFIFQSALNKFFNDNYINWWLILPEKFKSESKSKPEHKTEPIKEKSRKDIIFKMIDDAKNTKDLENIVKFITPEEKTIWWEIHNYFSKKVKEINENDF